MQFTSFSPVAEHAQHALAGGQRAVADAMGEQPRTYMPYIPGREEWEGWSPVTSIPNRFSRHEKGVSTSESWYPSPEMIPFSS
jgi:hypothetical protein